MDEIWWTRLGQLGAGQSIVMVLLFLLLRPTFVRGLTLLEALVLGSPDAQAQLAKAKEAAELEVPNADPSVLGRLVALFVGTRAIK